MKGMIHMATRRKAAEPVVEDDAFEELEDVEGEELEEIEEVEEEPAPKRRRGAKSTTKAAPEKPAAAGSEFNTAWLANHVSEVTGIEIDGRGLRMILRKMASDGDFPREVGEDRQRYTFPKGANDPNVKRVIARVKAGNAAKAEAPVEKPVAKTTKAAPAKKTTAKKTAPAKAAPRRRRAAAEAE